MSLFLKPMFLFRQRGAMLHDIAGSVLVMF